MISNLRRTLCLVLLGVVAPGIAWAGGPRDHEKGFFLRMLAGGGSAGSKIESGSDSIDLSGTSGVFDLAIGGTVAPNLAIYGTFFGWLVSDPDAEVKVGGVGNGSGSINGDLDMTAFGAGVTYYFMPINLYLAGNIGMGSLSGDGGDLEGLETDSGLALNFLVGKEWWVSGRWGLGVAGAFGYHSFPDKDVDENWTGTNFSLLFSVTFN
jgi:hypothetical protein